MNKGTPVRLIWLLNVVLMTGLAYAGYWTYGAQLPQPPKERVAEVRATGAPPSAGGEPVLRRQVTEAQLKQVFKRDFAVPSGRSIGRPDANASLASIVPAAVPVPRSEAEARAPAPSIAPDAEPAAPKPATKPAGPPLDSLVSLVAIFHDLDPARSAIVIENKKSRRQELYVIGDVLQGIDAAVVKIEETQATFVYGGGKVILELQSRVEGAADAEAAHRRSASVSRPRRNQEPGRGPIDPNYHHVVPRQEIMKIVQEPIPVLKGIRYALVRDENDQVLGFRINGVTDESLVGKYGVRNNDVIRAINGTQIDAGFNPFTMVTHLLASDFVRLTVQRNGKDLDLTYQFGN